MKLTILSLFVCSTSIFAQPTVKYKTCANSETCNYLRNKTPNPEEYSLSTSFIQVLDNSIRFQIARNKVDSLNLLVTVYDSIIRLQIEELDDPSMYYADDVLNGEPHAEDCNLYMKWNITSNSLAMILATFDDDQNLVSFDTQPLLLGFYYNQSVIALLNDLGRITFEKDAGHSGISFDVTFLTANQVYGLPLHADDLLLRETGIGGDDPYRLYNLNVPNYAVGSTQALSGSVPLMYFQGEEYTGGIFFHNGYETWVDYSHTDKGCNAHFMAQNGVVDAFFLLGPTPADVFKQYILLTGLPPLPPYWSLGYHHGTTSADTDEDITALVANFDSAEIPVDAIFLTDRYSSFKFNTSKYTDPENLQSTLSSTGRKLVGMVNPYIKVDLLDDVFVEAFTEKYLIYAPSGQLYTGDSYPGVSSWWDFTNIYAWDFYEGLFLYANYTGATSTLAGFLNSLNEPVVFNEEERVLPEDDVHYGGFTHRDVHNIYSHLMNQRTYTALLERDENVRPFVVSEAFFSGTQRFSAVHTGENSATWEHLRASVQMCLTASVTGFSFCGANIGGYHGDPDRDLLYRWYQVGAWLPFFRTQYSDDSPRREPHLLTEVDQEYIRTALSLRYAHIQIWYTLFYEQERFGIPVIRPIFFQYPNERTALTVQDGYFVGDNILVYPVTESNASTIRVYLPQGQFWYDVQTQLIYNGIGFTTLPVYPLWIPVLYRGGSIIARKENPVRSTADPDALNTYTVYIFLDNAAEAHGTIYIDDGRTFDYRKNVYYYLSLDYTGGTIQLNPIDSDASYPDAAFVVEQYLLYRPPNTMTKGAEPVPVEPEVITHTADGRFVRDIDLNLSKNNMIKLRIK